MLVFRTCYGQEFELQEPNIVLPSPTAYELGKYGQIPVGLFTGTINYSLPLYEYKTKHLSIPISLSYSSNGIKVDQLESNVGLGWSLNSGGVITKIVRGKEDESNKFFYPEEELDEVGMNSPVTAEFFYTAGMGEVDTETDLFMYNFPGGSGKFTYDNDKKIILIPHKDHKIEPYIEGEESGYCIITSDGVQYIFTDTEQTISRVHGGGHSIPEFTAISSWYLSKIAHPFGDTINFEYEPNVYYYDAGQSQTLKTTFPYGQTPCGESVPSAPQLSNILYHRSRIIGKRLIKIKSNNIYDGEININYGQSHPSVASYNLVSNIFIRDNNLSLIENVDFNYYSTANGRLFLDKVQYKDPNKSYLFEYIDPDGFPERLSFSQDHWGYFNNKNNDCLVPKLIRDEPFRYLNIGANKEPNSEYAKKGLLNKITYPTKGYTEMIYEGNSYFGEKTIPATFNQFIMEVNRGFDVSVSDIQTFTSDFPQQVKIYIQDISFNDEAQHCNDDPGKTKATLKITNNSTGEAVQLYRINSYGQRFYDINALSPSCVGNVYYVDLKTANYTFNLKPDFFCIKAKVKIEYIENQETTVDAIIETGGIRIKRTIDYDPVKDKELIKRYYYGYYDSLTIPTGDQGQKSYYINNITTRKPCWDQGLNGQSIVSWDDVRYKILNSNSLNPLFNNGNNNIYYKNVVISYGDDNFKYGGEEHEFIIHRDYPGKLIHGENYIRNAPWTNFGWDNSLEKKSSIFKTDDLGNRIILKESENNYYADNRNYDEVKGYSVRKSYDLVLSGETTYSCTEADIDKIYTEHYCAADHKHFWSATSNGCVCIAPGHDWQTRYHYHPCYGKQQGDVIVYSNNIENLDVMEYKNISFWHYLKNSITKQYDENGENPIITNTNYYYDNAEHVQLTRSKTLMPNGDTVLSKMFYPHDLGINSLIDQRRIGELVKSERYMNDKKIATKIIDYIDWGNNIILPEVINFSKGDNTPEARFRYHAYDEKGNPLEVSKENDMHIVYYWGYDDKYPVIKAENISYSDLNSVVQETTDNFDALLESIGDLTTKTEKNAWKAFCTNLINNPSLSNALITFYTYKPMVGITSETDARGQTIYYTYDSFGRLERICDNDGNIVKENEYNYAQ